MPTYGGHPLPGMPAFGWGPVFSDDEQYPLGNGKTRRGRAALVVGLLITCGALAAVMIAVLASQTHVL